MRAQRGGWVGGAGHDGFLLAAVTVRAGDVGQAGHAEVDGAAAGCEAVELGEFVGGGGEADVEAFGFAGPVLPAGFVDAGEQVVADGYESWPLVRVEA